MLINYPVTSYTGNQSIPSSEKNYELESVDHNIGNLQAFWFCCSARDSCRAVWNSWFCR